MQAKALLLAVLLISSSFAVRMEEQSTLSTEQGGPAEMLIDHVAQIATDLREEQFQHDTLYASQHSECESEIEERTQAILDGEDALRRAEAHHTRCEASYHESEADLAQIEAYQTQIAATKQNLAMRRQTEREAFLELINNELDPAISAVRGAYPIIDDFADGATSFAQITQHMGKTFKSVVKVGFGANMAAPLTAVLQLQQGFDAGTIEQVRSLFQQLEEDLVEAKNNAITTENTRQETYDQTLAEFNQILATLETTAEELTTYSAEMQACVAQEESIIDSATSKIRNNKAALRYAVEMCTAFETEYQNASQGRRAEIELLERLKEFIREQSEIFGDYGADSTNVFQDYREQYESQLESQVNMFIQMRAEKSKEHRKKMTKALKFSPKHKK